jgi:chorismate synthase
MSGNSFGQLFKITTFGESHGGAVGVIVDGCPPGLKIDEYDIQPQLDRRKPGQSAITTPRQEQDEIHIMSGLLDGVTTGTPIMLMAYNKDAHSQDYDELKAVYRPGHADFTYSNKYGVRDYKGSGRASARETLARVAAGAIARKFLKVNLGIEFLSYVEQVGNIKTEVDFREVRIEDIEDNIIRCPDKLIAPKMIALIEEVRDLGDSIGGAIKGIIKGLPVGLGEPVFDKLNADLAKAMMSINAAKAFEIGSGFSAIAMRGSQHNDEFYVDRNQNVRTKTNFAGGILGGISNGEDIHFRLAIKPVSTISKTQRTININNESVKLNAGGRHDPCVLPRAVPIVDAMAALVIMDHYMRNKAQNG